MRCYFTVMIWYHYSKYTPPLSMLAILESSNLRDSNMQAFYSRQYATFFDTQHTLDTGSRFTAAIQNGGMSPDIANTLSPVIPPASSLKWADVFKSVTISGDESIPINKRGSGSKRLILLNFFRAEVERRKDEANAPGIIYAIEEPETSQHSENQKKLINALIALSTESNVQQSLIM